MGYGEVVGNASVHWTIVHEDDNGAPVALSPKPGRRHPKVGHEVHVEENCCGCDPLSLEHVGARKGHGGNYRVTLRYERKEDARAAAKKLKAVERNGVYELVLDVPVVYRADPDDPPPPEIRIDW
jgi:hypothetical protein